MLVYKKAKLQATEERTHKVQPAWREWEEPSATVSLGSTMRHERSLGCCKGDKEKSQVTQELGLVINTFLQRPKDWSPEPWSLQRGLAELLGAWRVLCACAAHKNSRIPAGRPRTYLLKQLSPPPGSWFSIWKRGTLGRVDKMSMNSVKFRVLSWCGVSVSSGPRTSSLLVSSEWTSNLWLDCVMSLCCDTINWRAEQNNRRMSTKK